MRLFSLCFGGAGASRSRASSVQQPADCNKTTPRGSVVGVDIGRVSTKDASVLSVPEQTPTSQQRRHAEPVSAERGLCTGLMQSTLQHMTAIDLTNKVIQQNELSMGYFGDLRAQLHEDLATHVLKQLLRLEGRQVLEEVLRSVVDAEADGVWHRVVRVPLDCCASANAGEGAPTRELQGRQTERLQGGVHVASGSVRRQSVALATDALHAPMGDGLPLCREGSDALAARVPSVAAVMQMAGDVSVAMRNAPAMVRSMMELSMVNNPGANSKDADKDCERLGSAETLDMSSAGGATKHAGLAQRVHTKQARRQLRRCLTQPFLQAAAGSGAGRLPDLGLPGCLLHRQDEAKPPAGSPSCKPRRKSCDQGLQYLSQDGQELTSSQERRARPDCHDDDVSQRTARVSLMGASRPDGNAAKGASQAHSATKVATVPTDDPAAEGREAVASAVSNASNALASNVNTCLATLFKSTASYSGEMMGTFAATNNSSTVSRLARQAALPPPLLSQNLAILREQLGTPGMGGGALSDCWRSLELMQDQAVTAAKPGAASSSEEEVAFLWHEVRILKAKNPANNEPMLLIYQTDVTSRTQLEMTMAGITGAQLTTLTQIFPRHVVEHLSIGQGALKPASLGKLARTHHNVSILFMDIVGFTSMSKQVPATQVMTFLNGMFSVFDDLCSVHGVHKLETAGDCYIVSSGLVADDGEGFFQAAEQHDPIQSAARLFEFAKDMLVCSREVTMPHDGTPVNIRIGIHTGPCTSGVVGAKLPKFSVFGDTMNTASRMESTCTPGRIQLSATTHTFVLQSGVSDPSEWQGTGGIEIKGKGLMNTFLWQEPADISTSYSNVFVGFKEDSSQPFLITASSPYASTDNAVDGHAHRSRQPVQMLGSLRDTLLPEEEEEAVQRPRILDSTSEWNAASQDFGPRRTSLSFAAQGARAPSSGPVQPARPPHVHGHSKPLCMQSMWEAGCSMASVSKRAKRTGSQLPLTNQEAVPAFVSQFQAFGQLSSLVSQGMGAPGGGVKDVAANHQISAHLNPLSCSDMRLGSGAPRRAASFIVRNNLAFRQGMSADLSRCPSELASLQNPAELSTRIMQLLRAGPGAYAVDAPRTMNSACRLSMANGDGVRAVRHPSQRLMLELLPNVERRG